MDQIHIKGLKIFAYHGVNDYEKRDGQQFVFDCTVWRDLSAAMSSDNVDDTLSYARLMKLIASIARETQYDLLERLGDDIIAQVLDRWPEVARVRLTIGKPDINIADLDFDWVGVTLTRERSHA